MSTITPSRRGGNPKLTAEQARAVRLSPDPAQQLAAQYGVNPRMIDYVRSGRTYGPLKPDEQAAQNARKSPRGDNPQPLTLADYMLIVTPVSPAQPIVGKPEIADRLDQIEQRDAIHECEHGRLAGDRSPPCGCFPQEQTNPNPNPRSTNEHLDHRARLERFAAQARQQHPADERVAV